MRGLGQSLYDSTWVKLVLSHVGSWLIARCNTNPCKLELSYSSKRFVSLAKIRAEAWWFQLSQVSPFSWRLLVDCWIGAIGIRHRQGHKNPTLEIRPPRFKKKLWFGTYKQPRDVLRARDAALYYMGFPNDLVFPDSQARFSKLHLGIQFGDLDPECTSIVNVEGKPLKKHTYFAKEVKRVIKIVLAGKDKSSPELPPPQQQQPPQTPDSCNTWDSHPLSEAIDPHVCLIDPSSIRPIYTTSPSEWQFTDTICDSSPTFSNDLASSSLPHYSSPNSLPIASPPQDASSSIDGTYGLVQSDLRHYQLITPNSHCNITSAVTSEAVFPNDNIPIDWALQDFLYPNFDSVFLNPNFGFAFLPDSDLPCDFGGGLIGPMLGDHCDMSDEGWRYNYSYPLWTSYFLHHHDQRSTRKAVTAATGALYLQGLITCNVSWILRPCSRGSSFTWYTLPILAGAHWTCQG